MDASMELDRRGRWCDRMRDEPKSLPQWHRQDFPMGGPDHLKAITLPSQGVRVGCSPLDGNQFENFNKIESIRK